MKTKTTHVHAFLIASLLACGPFAVANADGFVDSVYGWGTWELGIEPAAGGPIARGGKPARVNQEGVQFRPNSNAAFTTPGNIVMTTRGDSPVPPPVTPTPPIITSGTPGAGPGLGNVR